MVVMAQFGSASTPDQESILYSSCPRAIVGEAPKFCN